MLGRLLSSGVGLVIQRPAAVASVRLLPRCFSSLEESLIVTKSCAQRIKELKRTDKNDGLKLRVSVEGGGCSGFSYHFAVDSNPVEENDIIFERDGEKVVVDPDSFELLKGATVDYVQEMIKASFAIVNNPSSESACGCGSSFAIKNFTTNPAID